MPMRALSMYYVEYAHAYVEYAHGALSQRI